jgi:pimeloyl-ACP methyl ester carboxylesterase
MSTPRLHINALGLGWPGVVLEPGLGASSIGWSRVQHAAASRTRVIAYDRAGLGSSPPCLYRRGLRDLADDLAHVIETGHGKRPAIVVGHSLGATIARQLASTRPDLIAGLILIDPIPEQWVLRYRHGAEPIAQVMYRTLETLARARLIDTVTTMPPFARIIRSSTSPQAPFTNAERAALAEEMRRPRSHRTARQEFSALLRSRQDLRALGNAPPTNIPLTVISAGHSHRLASPLRRAATAWHATLTHANPHAHHMVVPHADHFMPRYHPDTIATAITDLVDRIRHP